MKLADPHVRYMFFLLDSSGDKYLDKKEYADFNNQEDRITWENPYASFSPSVRHPEGVGGVALAPDNTLMRGRLTGLYVFSPAARLQFDGSYGVTEQDQDFLPYSVNDALRVMIW